MGFERQSIEQDGLALREEGASCLFLEPSTTPLMRRLADAGFRADRETLVVENSRVRSVPRNTDIFSEGDALGGILFLCEGWACRYRLLGDGRRHVIHFLVPGDLIGPFTPTAKQFAATLTPSSVCRVSHQDLAVTAEESPAFNAAVEAFIAAEYDLLAERTVSLGRRNAKERMAHLLLELFDRLGRVGLVFGNMYDLPLTQEMISDALGLSVVHVNRTLRCLREQGLVTIGDGRVTIHDLKALLGLADFGDGASVPGGDSNAIVSPLKAQRTAFAGIGALRPVV